MSFLFSFSLVIGRVWDFFEVIYPFDIACVRINDVVDISDLCRLESVVSVFVTASPVSFSVLVLVPVLGSIVSVPAVVVVSVVYTWLVSVLILTLVPALGETSPVVGFVVVGWVTWGGLLLVRSLRFGMHRLVYFLVGQVVVPEVSVGLCGYLGHLGFGFPAGSLRILGP